MSRLTNEKPKFRNFDVRKSSTGFCQAQCHNLSTEVNFINPEVGSVFLHSVSGGGQMIDDGQGVMLRYDEGHVKVR